MMNVARTHDDGHSAAADDERRSRSPSSAASKLPTLLAPARAQMSAAEQAPQHQAPRPPLRARSTGGVTTSSHNTGSSTLGAGDPDNHARHLVGHGPGQEFMPAEVPSPILSGPNQGLAGLSEALAHLISKNDSAASASSSSHVSPVVSRRGSDSANQATSTSNSTTDIKAHLPATLVTALIANASKTGRRLSSGSVPQSSEGADGPVHPSQIASGSSSRQQPGGRAGLPLRQTRDRSPPPASIGSLGAGRHVEAGGHSPAVFRRGSQDIDAISPLTAVTTTSMSQQSSPDMSGMSTPQNKFSSRSKPKVLETTHLHLQTHGPSGRRMINQYIIEDELGRGVHGKVRLARNVETGERVAVKIVERESRKRLGGGAGQMGHGSSSKLSRNEDARETEANGDTGEQNPDIAALSALNKNTQPQTRFAPTPVKPVSPGPHGRFAASNLRLGRWGEGAPGRPTHGDMELEKQRETARKRLLWTTDQKVKREIAIMKKCSHENVVGLKEVIDDPHSKKIFMVLEYMEGGEVQWKDGRGFPTLTVDDARRTFRDIVLGLEYLHYQGIIHRDIKPANLLWDKEHRVKISDFGVSHFSYALLVASGGIPSLDGDEGRQKDPSLADDRELAKTAGSPAFFAPELCLAGEPHYTTLSTVSTGSQRQEKGTPTNDEFPFSQESQVTGKRTRPPITKAIDLWALGVTLFCLLFGHVPFTADSEYALFSVICREDYALPSYMGADRIRIGPRKKRWIYQQPWTDEEGDVDEDSSADLEADVDPSTLCEDALMVRDLLDRLLEKDPTKRIKLEEVKKHPWLVRDIADPPQWLSETDPAQLPYVVVTHEDVEFALTGFSKFKQTLKRFQSKIMSSFAGVGHSHHSHERDSQHSSSRPSTPGHANSSSGIGAPVRRRRSKSASHASRDFLPAPSIRTASTTASSSRTSPQNTMDSRRASHHHAHAKHNFGGTGSHPPIAPSAKPFHFFSRGRSNVLDSEKRLLAIPKYGKHSHIHGTSVSQPNSRPHSPKNTSPPSLILDVSESNHSGPFPASSLASSRREVDAGRPSTAHSSDIRDGGAILSTLPKRPSSKHLLLRPASRGSLRALDALTFTASTGGEQDLHAEKNTGEGEFPSHLQGTPSTSRNPSSSSTGPARPRSRSRLSDVFKSVLSGGTHHFHHHHAANPTGTGDARSLRLRSRPSTAVNSAAVTPTFDKSEGAKDHKPPFVSSEAEAKAIEALPLPITAPASPVEAKEEPLKATHASEHEENGEDRTEGKELQGNAIDVDDYDVDLDFSEDDEDSADEHHHSPSYQNSSGPIMRGTREGWVVDDQRDEIGGGDDRGAILSDTNSLTPSVEGGYNVFKPPFAGRFQLNSEPIISHQHEGEQAYAMDVLHSDEVAALRRANKADRTLLSTSLGESEGECESDVSSCHVETIPTKHRYARLAQKKAQHGTPDGNAHIGAENNVHDTSVVSEDRFADADEETTLHQVHALRGHRATDKPHFSLGSSARNSDADASEGVSPAAIEDDDGGVSFRTGKRSNR